MTAFIVLVLIYLDFSQSACYLGCICFGFFMGTQYPIVFTIAKYMEMN